MILLFKNNWYITIFVQVIYFYVNLLKLRQILLESTKSPLFSLFQYQLGFIRNCIALGLLHVHRRCFGCETILWL